MVKALLWKEWRENRLLLGLGILFLCAFRLLPFLTDFKDMGLVSLFMFLVCGIFSVLIGATGFSQEIDRNTLSFIASKPVSRSMLWIAKVASNLFLIGILFVVAILLSIEHLEKLNLLKGEFRLCLVLWTFSLAFLFYAFSFLISTLI
ncbi:MAG: ABC transporter permease subunit, partial [Planctomycetes bacterium]|nr:ABC transporter permease subunit [Planctomycetota bacterium]